MLRTRTAANAVMSVFFLFMFPPKSYKFLRNQEDESVSIVS